MSSEIITITQAEWSVMEVLWEKSPLSATEIFDNLSSKGSWTSKTVRSFLDRLIKKNAVKKSKIHGINVFKPIPSRKQCLQLESSNFMDRFFKGNPISMISHMIEDEQLSNEDLQRLQKLLEDKQTK